MRISDWSSDVCSSDLQRVAGAVGVDGRHRAVVARVHGLEHVEGLAATALPHHYAVGTHAEAVLHEVADGDLTGALDVRGARLHAQQLGSASCRGEGCR